MLVAFGTSDMISCYWHLYHLWSGLDVLYRLFNNQCPRVVSIVLIHSVIFHIVHVHTWSGVCCCQIYLTCWWFLAHWTWRHVFLTCYMLVAFGTSDMISCYWHVYCLWSGLDILYRFRSFHCLHPLPSTAYHPQHFRQILFHGLASVTSTIHVGGLWYIWHEWGAHAEKLWQPLGLSLDSTGRSSSATVDFRLTWRRRKFNVARTSSSASSASRVFGSRVALAVASEVRSGRDRVLIFLLVLLLLLLIIFLLFLFLILILLLLSFRFSSSFFSLPYLSPPLLPPPFSSFPSCLFPLPLLFLLPPPLFMDPFCAAAKSIERHVPSCWPTLGNPNKQRRWCLESILQIRQWFGHSFGHNCGLRAQCASVGDARDYLHADAFSRLSSAHLFLLFGESSKQLKCGHRLCNTRCFKASVVQYGNTFVNQEKKAIINGQKGVNKYVISK